MQYLREKDFLSEAPDMILSELLKTIGLGLCSAPFVSVAQESLDQRWTRDPFDRLIVAHAKVHKRPLITKDKMIAENYGKVIW